MADAAQFVYGKAMINGIQGLITINTSADNHTLEEISGGVRFDSREVKSPSGAAVRMKVYYNRRKECTIRFAPTGANAAAALASLAAYLALNPGAEVVIAASTVAFWNGTYNYDGGAEIAQTPEGTLMVGIQLVAYEVEGNAGTFAALPVVT